MPPLFNICNTTRVKSEEDKWVAQHEKEKRREENSNRYSRILHPLGGHKSRELTSEERVEAIVKALQALADAHNDMEMNRDPEPKQQMRDKHREKKEAAKEMKAFNKLHRATAGSHGPYYRTNTRSNAPFGCDCGACSGCRRAEGARRPGSPRNGGPPLYNVCDGDFIGNSGVRSLVPGGKVVVKTNHANTRHSVPANSRIITGTSAAASSAGATARPPSDN